MIARALLPLFALAALLLAPPAHAQEPAPDERIERARALFEQAEAAMTAEQFAAAAEGYRQSYELLREAGRPTAPLVLYNSALAWERGGERERALEAFRRFLDEATAQDEETRRRVLDARARVAALEAPAPTVAPAPVAPPPEATASEPPAPVAEPSGGGGGISPIGPILMGAGGALFVTGMILGGVALGRDGDFEAMCPGRTGCDPALRAQWDETRTLALAGDVLWIGGAVVAATGLVLTFVLTEGGEGSDASAALACGLGECAVRGTF